MCSLAGLVAPVLVSALCGSCQPLVGRPESQNDLLQKPRGPGADVGSLVDAVRIQKPTGRQAGPGVWLQGLRNLVIGGGGGYRNIWIQSLRYLKVCVGLLVGRARASWSQGMVWSIVGWLGIQVVELWSSCFLCLPPAG